MELTLLRELKRLISENKDSFLKVQVTKIRSCCSYPTTEWVFRNPTAFQINVLLEKIDKLKEDK